MTANSLTMPLIIRALGRGKKGSRNLTFEESHFVMESILDGSITPAQLGAFLMLMRVKEETPEELSGMVNAIHEFLPNHGDANIDINWPAYAGKKKQPSWYIASAKLLAQNGIKIFVHGGGEHTPGRQYARQACEALNISVAKDLNHAKAILSHENIAYLPLDAFLPALSSIIDMKAELGLRSPANTLVRHIDPFRAKLTLQGMFHPAYMPMHHLTAVYLKQNNNIVLKGDGGEFEVRPDSDTPVQILKEETLPNKFIPAVLKTRSVRPETVTMQPLTELWAGKIEHAYGQAAIIETATLVLTQLKGLATTQARLMVTKWWQNRLNH